MRNFGGSFLVLLLAASAAATIGATAHPGHWIRNAASCTSLPTTVVDGFEQQPTPDWSATLLLVEDKTGATVDKVCPGGVYQLKASFPRAAEAFISASTPSRLEDHTKECSNQAATRIQVKSYYNSLIVSCKAKGAVDVSLTWSTGPAEPLLLTTASFPVSKDCKMPADCKKVESSFRKLLKKDLMPSGNIECTKWCHANLSKQAAVLCTADAAQGRGPCYVCGPRSGAGLLGMCGDACCGMGSTSSWWYGNNR